MRNIAAKALALFSTTEGAQGPEAIARVRAKPLSQIYRSSRDTFFRDSIFSRVGVGAKFNYDGEFFCPRTLSVSLRILPLHIPTFHSPFGAPFFRQPGRDILPGNLIPAPCILSVLLGAGYLTFEKIIAFPFDGFALTKEAGGRKKRKFLFRRTKRSLASRPPRLFVLGIRFVFHSEYKSPECLCSRHSSM